MMLSFDSVAQNKSTCPPSAAPPSVQSPGVTGASTVKQFQSQVSNEQSKNFTLVN